MLGTGNGADHFRSLRSCYGDGGRTNSAGRTRDGDTPVFEVANLLQRLERGDAAEPQGGHVERIEVRSKRRGCGRSDSDILGVAARPPGTDTAKPLHHGDNAI